MPEVVTSENLAEFNASRLRLTPVEPKVEAKAEDKPAEVKPEDGKPSEAKPEDKPTEKKPKESINQRFSELTAARRAAEEKAEANERELKRVQAELEALKKPIPKAEERREPQAAEYANVADYAKAYGDWAAEEALAKRDREDAEKREKAKREEIVASWNKRLAQTKAEIEDYDEVLAASDLSVSDQVRDALMESDLGPQMVYHLASNPELVESINKMTVPAALRAIGKLEAKLEKPAEDKKPEPKTELKAIVKPPAPIVPIKAATVPDEPFDSAGEFTGTPRQWKELRKAGKIK